MKLSNFFSPRFVTISPALGGRRPGPLAPALLAVAGLGFVGCSVVVDGLTEQCSTDAECLTKGLGYEGTTCEQGLCLKSVSSETAGAGGGGGGGGAPGAETPWGCLDSLAYQTPPGDTATLGVRLSDPLDTNDLPGLSVSACGRIDGTCSEPLAGPIVTDSEGRAELSLSGLQQVAGIPGFPGYFYITGADRLPLLYTVHPPLTANYISSFPVPTQGQIDGFSILVGSQPIPERAGMILHLFDCKKAQAARLTVRVLGTDSNTQAYYSTGGTPSALATETDDGGVVFIANVPVGLATVEVTSLEAGRLTARTTIQVRLGHVSYAEIFPMPL